MALSSTTTHVTFEEFLRLDLENPHVEWVNGEIVPMAPVSDAHQDIAGLLYATLRAYVERWDLGIVRHEPFQMKLGPGLPSRAPDILFVAKKRLSRVKKVYVDGPADLVIEVISPGSAAIDRGEKFNEYDEGGVREYWIVDSARRRADFYRRDRGALRAVVADDDNVYRSIAIKGLWIRTEWLWSRPLPKLLEIQRAWKLT
jgi:Uma2 family endonuclease